MKRLTLIMATLFIPIFLLKPAESAEPSRLVFWNQGKVNIPTPHSRLLTSPSQVSQVSPARSLTKGPRSGDTWYEPITGMEFVFVERGCFEMGDTFGDGYKDETPAHEVCVDGFWMGKYEVTQGQWGKVSHYNPSFYPRGDNYPVEQVTWNDTQEFSQKLSQNNRKQFRLPTEAQWEYAARSGGKREKWAGTSDESKLTEYAWESANSGNGPHPVGQKRPTGLGLYDMSGNVWEWCQDSYDENYYNNSPRNNPKGPLKGRDKVARGGSWIVGPWYCRTSYREWVDPSDRYYYFGFRLVVTSD